MLVKGLKSPEWSRERSNTEGSRHQRDKEVDERRNDKGKEIGTIIYVELA